MESEIDFIINCFKRAKNCEKALYILQEIRKNSLFCQLEMTKEHPWMLQLNERKWIDHMKSKIDEAIKLIEGDDDGND